MSSSAPSGPWRFNNLLFHSRIQNQQSSIVNQSSLPSPLAGVSVPLRGQCFGRSVSAARKHRCAATESLSLLWMESRENPLAAPESRLGSDLRRPCLLPRPSSFHGCRNPPQPGIRQCSLPACCGFTAHTPPARLPHGMSLSLHMDVHLRVCCPRALPASKFDEIVDFSGDCLP